MTFRHIIIGTAIAASLTGAARAAPDAARHKAQTLCADDAARLCGDAMGDDAKTEQCMNGKRAELSPACRKAAEALK